VAYIAVEITFSSLSLSLSLSCSSLGRQATIIAPIKPRKKVSKKPNTPFFLVAQTIIQIYKAKKAMINKNRKNITASIIYYILTFWFVKLY
jgi:hypothetical protein